MKYFVTHAANFASFFSSFYSSETERDFTMDFLLAAEFIEAVLYRPYFESSAEFLAGFPHRLLTDQDRNVLTSNFSRREKALMTVAKLITKINKSTGMIVSYTLHEA